MVFFGISSTLIDAHTLPGQTVGLKVGCGGKNKVFIKPLALGWAEGEGLGWVFFWDWLNVHTFDSRHRADRRVEGWLRR